MTPYLYTSPEPCELIENWKAAEIRNDENSKAIPACWLRVGDMLEIVYWSGGMVFKVEVKAEKSHVSH